MDGIGGDDRAPVRGPGAGTRAWLDDHARIVAGGRTARTLAAASTRARTPAVRVALGRAAARAAGDAAEVARTAEIGAAMAAYQPGPAEVLGMGAAVLGSTLLGVGAGTVLLEGTTAAGWGAVGPVLGPVSVGGALAGGGGYLIGQGLTNIAEGRDPTAGLSLSDLSIAAAAGAIMPGVGSLRAAPLPLVTRPLAGAAVGTAAGAASDSLSGKDTPTPVTGGLGAIGAAADMVHIPYGGSALLGFGVSVASTFLQNLIVGQNR
jgi:hypothetical protein